MANEAKSIEKTLLNAVIRRVGSTGGPKIVKGSLLVLGDNNLVSGSHTATSGASVFGGVAAADRVSGTTIAAFMDGVWDMKVVAEASVTMGAKVSMSGANLIKDALAGEVDAGGCVGVAEEAGASNEVIRVRLTNGA